MTSPHPPTKRPPPPPSPSSLSSVPQVDADGFERHMTRGDKRKQRKVDKHRPQFQFDTSQFKHGKKIGIAHIRDLVVYIAADGQKPGWIVPEHKSYITHVVLLFTPGLLPQHLGLDPLPPSANLPFSTTPDPSSSSLPVKVPAIAKLFTYGCPTRAPGDQRRLHSVLGTLLQCPLSDDKRRKREEEGRKAAAAAKADSTNPLPYLLTPNQMIDNDYILPSYLSASDQPIISPNDSLSGETSNGHSRDDAGEAAEYGVETMVRSAVRLGNGGSSRSSSSGEGWMETPKADGPPENGVWPVLAVDCEMVLTEDGQELARASFIDFYSGVTVLDEFVKPAKPVTDYRTQWSGITPAKLASAPHTLASLQQILLSASSPLITPHTILLGHSLECDLAALKIRHALCIDTALIFKHPRGPPFKPGLKWLVQRWMGQEIQGGKAGHDSEEDAGACVGLLRLKMANGPDFGTFLDTTTSLFELINRSPRPSDISQKRTTAMADIFNPRSGHGRTATKHVKCEGDREVVEGILEGVTEGCDVVFGRMGELAQVQGWNDHHKHPDPLPAPSSPSSPSEDPSPPASNLESALSAFSTRLLHLHANLPPSTALILLTGHSDPLPMLRLTEKRQKWERLVKTLGGIDKVPAEERWMSEDERELEGAVGAAREGMAFFCVKG